MQVLGGAAGGRGLGGVLLGGAQAGDVLDERGQARDQGYLGEVRVAGNG